MLLIPQEPGVYVPQGNRLLFELLGAEVRIIDGKLDDAGLLAAQEAVQDELSLAGRQPVVFGVWITGSMRRSHTWTLGRS